MVSMMVQDAGGRSGTVKLVVMPGDGIGPEITAATLSVLRELDGLMHLGLVFEEVPVGRFTWFSFLASSAAFGLLHGRWVAGTLAGLVYAVALFRRRQLADAYLAHATTNALIAADVLWTGAWSLWS